MSVPFIPASFEYQWCDLRSGTNLILYTFLFLNVSICINFPLPSINIDIVYQICRFFLYLLMLRIIIISIIYLKICFHLIYHSFIIFCHPTFTRDKLSEIFFISDCMKYFCIVSYVAMHILLMFVLLLFMVLLFGVKESRFTQVSIDSGFEPWSLKRTSILSTYTTSETIPITTVRNEGRGIIGGGGELDVCYSCG